MTCRSISRRDFVAGSLLAGVSASACGRPSMPEERPNIVLCMGDDHGWHETGYNGHPHVRTPVLDEMAASGLRFDRFYAAAPVCSPTRGSVMTGRHPNRYGTFSANRSIRPEEISIAQILSAAGYACGHFGKWHLGPVKAGSPTNPGALGFEEWLSHDNFFEMDPVLSRNGGTPQRYPGESSQIVVDAATDFMDRARSEDRPFFVVIWFGSPHEPYGASADDLAEYADLPADLEEQSARLTSLETGLPTSLPLDQVLQARYAEITAMDRALGDLRGHLDAAGVRGDTLLWYCSDNGAPSEATLGSPLRAHKGRVYEGGVRVPAVIEWPDRIPEPIATEVAAVTSDILPTLCDLTDTALPDRPLDGISLVGAIDGSRRERQEPICFWSYRGNQEGSGEPYIEPSLQQGTTPLVKQMNGLYTRNFRNFRYEGEADGDLAGPRAVLDNRFKLVVDGEGSQRADGADGPVRELYDIRQDPSEERDISEQHSDEVARLDAHLEQWQRSVLRSLAAEDY